MGETVAEAGWRRQNEVAWRENLEVALYLRVELGAVDDRAIGVGLVRGADLHLLHGEGVADDAPGQALDILTLLRQYLAAPVDIEPECTQPRSIRARSGGSRPLSRRNVITRARNSSSNGLIQQSLLFLRPIRQFTAGFIGILSACSVAAKPAIRNRRERAGTIFER